MLDTEVSGKKKKKSKTRVADESHMSSQIVGQDKRPPSVERQCQNFNCCSWKNGKRTGNNFVIDDTIIANRFLVLLLEGILHRL